MKRTFLGILAVLVISLCACSKDPEPTPQNTGRNPQVTESVDTDINDEKENSSAKNNSPTNDNADPKDNSSVKGDADEEALSEKNNGDQKDNSSAKGDAEEEASSGKNNGDPKDNSSAKGDANEEASSEKNNADPKDNSSAKGDAEEEASSEKNNGDQKDNSPVHDNNDAKEDVDDNNNDEDAVPVTDGTNDEDAVPVTDGTDDEDAEPASDAIDFEAIAKEAELRISKAIVQYEKEDYTRLSEPVNYNILMLGYTHVIYEELDFRMTDLDREYLEAVALNFEKTVERLTDHNIDISIDLYFIDDETELTQCPGEKWLYLACETVQKDIDKYDIDKKYDSVLTAVETAGSENAERNNDKSGYGVNYVMLGLKTAGVENGIGYSTFDLGKPREGTYPLADPEIPSLYATAVAVHEWMHQLEFIGNYLGIEYPDTHAYQGNIPGYQAYTADLNNYDYFEFYELVLAGKLPFTSNDTVKHVGMYPDMWPLAKRGVVLDEIGTFTIKNDAGEYLAGDVTTRALSVSKEESKWQIRYGGKNRFILLCDEDPSLRIDLGNAWDTEGNSIGVWVYTGYDDAQSWLLTQNSDGTYYIRTPYPSGSALAVDKPGAGAYLTENGTKWTFNRVNEE